MRRATIVLASVCALPFSAPAQTAGTETRLAGAEAPRGGWTVFSRSLETRRENGQEYIHFDERETTGLAWSPLLRFSDGDIEFDTRGRDLGSRSFVGIAFHIVNDTVFDAVYLRPFNFRAPDSLHHAHAVQFVSSPAYPWDVLRTQHPGMFEHPVASTLDPNGWVHIRVSVRGANVRVYLNNAAEPSLSVVNPSAHRTGGVGYFAHSSSNGDFKNLTITPTP